MSKLLKIGQLARDTQRPKVIGTVVNYRRRPGGLYVQLRLPTGGLSMLPVDRVVAVMKPRRPNMNGYMGHRYNRRVRRLAANSGLSLEQVKLALDWNK